MTSNDDAVAGNAASVITFRPNGSGTFAVQVWRPRGASGGGATYKLRLTVAETT